MDMAQQNSNVTRRFGLILPLPGWFGYFSFEPQPHVLPGDFAKH